MTEKRAKLPAKLFLIHFNPLELYPPVMNMLNFLSGNKRLQVQVFSFRTRKLAKDYTAPGVKIQRSKGFEAGSMISRQLSYVFFVLRVFYQLAVKRPDYIFYYETGSALPVHLYFWIFRNSRSRLLIHYHEYNSIEQYRRNMLFIRLSYTVEKSSLWKRAVWISHTNTFRKELFLKDYPWLQEVDILPNYPPSSWQSGQDKTRELTFPLKLVYVGSLGKDNFYIQELCDWIESCEGQLRLTIYTHNYTEEIRRYIEELNSEYINANFGAVWYYDLPDVLQNYQVGLILYKSFSDNYIFNETNKLFEYLACGLDVWFPEDTKGIYPHITENSYPKVVKIDFSDLNNIDLKGVSSRNKLAYKANKFVCEDTYRQFAEKVFSL